MPPRKKPVKHSVEVIVPIYNEELCLDELITCLFSVKNLGLKEGLDISFIFVNDGSSDRSLEILHSYADKHNYVKIINLSRNFGHQMAVTAGLDHASADYTAIIDADLQDPPELIPEMIKKARSEGLNIIYGQRRSRDKESFFKLATAKLFYSIIGKMIKIDIPKNTGDFRVIDRKVLREFKKMRELHRFIRGMIPWVGFKSAPFMYDRAARFAGETKYPFKKMLHFALDAIFSFSDVPLKVATHTGMFILFFALFGGILALFLRFFTTFTVPGITAVILTILIIGGIQIIMLGVIGEYIGRIFDESKRRPLYVVDEIRNLNEDIE